MRFLYDVKNIRTGELVANGISAGEVADMIGINKGNVSAYARDGNSYKGIYKISVSHTIRQEPWMSSWMKEWDESRLVLLGMEGEK